MAIPTFQGIFLPLLKVFNDEQQHSTAEIYELLEKYFQLTSEDKSIFLKRGDESLFTNRVRWAYTHLKAAHLIEATQKGMFRITERGLAILRNNPSELSEGYLKQFPEYIEFRRKKKKESSDIEAYAEPQTPEERIENAHDGFDELIQRQLFEKVRLVTPKFFERLVVDLLVKMGYGSSREDAARVVGASSGDEGIDGVISQDRLGTDSIYIQAKRWANPVGRPELQKFVGAMHGKSNKGVFLTTSYFTEEADEYVRAQASFGLKVILVDGEQLVKYMFEDNLGCTTFASYDMKKIDSDYFTNEIEV